MYIYNALVNRVVDGDTIHCNIDLGFNMWAHDVPLRILGINCREKSDAGGPEARAYTTGLLPAGSAVLVQSVKPDKYGGRWNATVTMADGRDLATVLIRSGYAAAWNGSGAKPIPPWPIVSA